VKISISLESWTVERERESKSIAELASFGFLVPCSLNGGRGGGGGMLNSGPVCSEFVHKLSDPLSDLECDRGSSSSESSFDKAVWYTYQNDNIF
jgi:hypothetical protein